MVWTNSIPRRIELGTHQACSLMSILLTEEGEPWFPHPEMALVMAILRQVETLLLSV